MSSFPSGSRLQAFAMGEMYNKGHVLDITEGTRLNAQVFKRQAANAALGVHASEAPLLGILVVSDSRVDALVGPNQPSVASVRNIIANVTAQLQRKAGPRTRPGQGGLAPGFPEAEKRGLTTGMGFTANSGVKNWPLVYSATMRVESIGGGQGAEIGASLQVEAVMYYGSSGDTSRGTKPWTVLPLHAGAWFPRL